jgi:hypothetical protein
MLYPIVLAAPPAIPFAALDGPRAPFGLAGHDRF